MLVLIKPIKTHFFKIIFRTQLIDGLLLQQWSVSVMIDWNDTTPIGTNKKQIFRRTTVQIMALLGEWRVKNTDGCIF